MFPVRSQMKYDSAQITSSAWDVAAFTVVSRENPEQRRTKKPRVNFFDCCQLLHSRAYKVKTIPGCSVSFDMVAKSTTACMGRETTSQRRREK